MDAVPTSVAQGPDGGFYVGQLTGFPFPVGGANVYRIVPGQAPQVFASGFTNIIDIAFDKQGTLYVLEIFQNGLLSGDPTGALIRVDQGGAQRGDVNRSDHAGWARPARRRGVRQQLRHLRGRGDVLRIPDIGGPIAKVVTWTRRCCRPRRGIGLHIPLSTARPSQPLQVLAGPGTVRLGHPHGHHVGEVDDHSVLAGLAVAAAPASG